jgi:hypothetical protein
LTPKPVNLAIRIALFDGHVLSALVLVQQEVGSEPEVIVDDIDDSFEEQ